MKPCVPGLLSVLLFSTVPMLRAGEGGAASPDPNTATSPGLFDSPLALFQKATVAVLATSERGRLETTWRGFMLKADRQAAIDHEDKPSEVGIRMDVQVRDAGEIPAAVETSTVADGTTSHIIRIPAIPGEGLQGLMVTIESGAKANKKALAAIDTCIEEIRDHAHVERSPATLKTGGPQPLENVLYAPDHQHYVVWFDTEPGPVLKEARTITFRATIEARDDQDPSEDVFSRVTATAWTQAAWNPASTGCIVADQPDNGSVFVWLISKDKSGKWRSRKFDPLAPLSIAHEQALNGKDTPLFRPHLDKIEWLSDTQARFLIWSNLNNPELESSGRYEVIIDTQKMDAAPAVAKLPPAEQSSGEK